jgi:drug/metabolite transporter (DMT)-like permease
MAAPAQPRRAPGTGAIWAALVSVYVAWGATYLAIRVTVRTIPPLMSASVRFLIAGALMYGWAVLRGDRAGDRPTLVHWRSAFVIGAAMLFGGNGIVSLAEQTVPSGITALLIATVPLWMVLMARFALGERVTWRETLGIVVGFGGAALLAQPAFDGRLDLLGVVLLLVASISWAAGSLYARRAPLPDRPLVGVGMEMLAGGVILAVASVVAGELGDLELTAISGESLAGLAYLIVGGSLVGFASYVWLLRVARTSLVATYAYVNPVVAVFLGWLILSERITVQTLIAGGVILAAVAIIVSARGAKESGAEPGAATAAEAAGGERLSA